MRKISGPWRSLALLTAVLAVAWWLVGPVQPPPGVKLADLNDVDELKTTFNSDAGSPRLILVLSPT